MLHPLLLLVALFSSHPAHAGEPDCPRKWVDRRPCLEKAMLDAPPVERSQISVQLIHDAWEARDLRAYDALLRRHLTSIDPTDADIAYLYARYLGDLGPQLSEEVLRWSSVAISNRQQWPDNVYGTRLKIAYDLRIEATLLLWKEALEDFSLAPSDEGMAEVEKYRTLARGYLAESGPCLAEGHCGPEYQVTVEAGTLCPELDPVLVKGKAQLGALEEGERACLMAMHDDPFASKRRLQSLLLADATAARDPARWQELITWYEQSFGIPNAAFDLGYAELLAEGGTEAAPEVLRLTAIALENEEQLSEKRFPGALARARVLHAWAEAGGTGAP